MSRPKFDPRLIEKNFAMPMNPGGFPQIIDGAPPKGGVAGPSPTTIPATIRRKDGVPQSSVTPPSYGPRKREPQETVRLNPRSGSASGYTHPFKIEVDADLKLRVNYGAASYTMILSDEWPHNAEVTTAWDLTASPDPLYLKNDPFNPTAEVGYSQLATSTTYGVWLVITTNSDFINNGLGTETEYTDLQIWHMIPDTCRVIVSSSQKSRLSPYFGDDGDIGYFLGSVAVDGDDVVTIIQHRRSDLVLPVVAVPRAIQFP